MWPSLETAVRVASLSNIFFIGSLVVGAVSTILIVWMANVKESYWDAARQASDVRIAELNNETEQLRAKNLDLESKIQRRKLTEEQKLSLIERLKKSGIPDVTIFMVKDIEAI